MKKPNFTSTKSIRSSLFAITNRFCCFIILAAILLFAATDVFAQISVSGAVGITNGTTYTSLTGNSGLFAALNGGSSQSGATIVVTVTASEANETGANLLTGKTAAWTSLTIETAGNYTISGSVAGAMITFNGGLCKNVTINGTVGGGYLTFSNTSNSSSACTFEFIGDAKSNAIQNCKILGSSTSTSIGTIFFSTGASTGNTGEIIQNDTIASASGGLPYIAIYSSGSSGTDTNTVSVLNNYIQDYFNPGAVSYGVFVGGGNGAWTITGNHLFQTGTRTTTNNNSNNHRAIFINNTSGGATDVYTISNNIIGYASAVQTGTTIYAGNFSNTFGGIEINISGTATASIQGNTIAGISLTTSQSSTSPGDFAGIIIDAGIANVGTTTGNTIGTGSASISIASSNSCGITGIYTNSSSACIVSNNIIQNINTAGSSGSVGFNFNGVWINNTGTGGSVSGNNIGNGLTNSIVIGINGTTAGNIVAYGIQYNSSANAVIKSNHIDTIYCYSNTSSPGALSIAGIYVPTAGSSDSISNNTINFISAIGGNSSTNNPVNYLVGIYCSTGSSLNAISGNTISNLTANSASSGIYVMGVYDISGTSTGNVSNITSNTISNLTTNAPNTSTPMIGIYFLPSNGNPVAVISQNTIYNLSNTYSSTANISVEGMYLYGGSGGIADTVSRNFIYSLSAANANTSATLIGITFNSGMTVLVVNNIIQLGVVNGSPITGSMNIYGIYENNPNQNNNYYYNSVYIGGSGVGSSPANNTFAFVGDDNLGNPSVHENNIFVNARSNASSGGTHYAVILNNQSNPTSTCIMNFNDYIASGTGGILGNYGTNTLSNIQNNNNQTVIGTSSPATGWRGATQRDSNSISSNPLFVNPAGATPDFHLQSGTPVASFSGAHAYANITTVDYYGNLRASYSPVTLGAVIADGIANPGTFTAAAGGSTQINLAATANSNSNNIVVIYHTGSAISGTPTQGVAPTAAGTVLAGTADTIFYIGPASGLPNQTGLNPNTTYYYEAYSYDVINNYSSGLTAQATTYYLHITYTTSTKCASSTISVPFTSTGTFNSGNVYTAQLSDATGSFSSPSTLGTLTSSSSGSQTINANPGSIPSNAATGSSYRIRVTSSSPAITGDSTSAFTINALPATPSVTDVDNCLSSTLSTTATGTLLWSTGATATAITVTTDGTYTVTQSNGTCTSIAGSATATPMTICNLSYPSPDTYTAGTTITNLNPTITGTPRSPNGYSVNPSLPLGLSLNTTTGVISGTPTTTTATATYTVTATNSSGNTTTFGITITVNPGALSTFAIALAGGGNIPTETAGSPFNIQITAQDANHNTVTSFNLTVALTVNATYGSISPTTSSSFVNGVLSSQSVTVTQATSQAITATNGSTGTSNTFSVVAGAFSQLQILVPGEIAAPGSATGYIGSPSNETAGSAFSVTVNAVDANWNAVSSTNSIAISSSDVNATLPSNAALVAGTQTFSVTLNTVGTKTITATDNTDGTKTANTSPSITVVAGTFAKMQILVPGETASPGSSTGYTGSPSTETAGSAFNVTVNAVDANWNVITTAPANTIAITSSDVNATLPSSNTLSSGTQTFSVTLNTAGSWTVTATNATDGTKTFNTSPPITVNAGTASMLQILLPGETAAPGTATGKTGTPTAQRAGASFTVTVNAVDGLWNVSTSTHTVGITSTDAAATLPGNAALAAGTQTFSITLNTYGSFTITATDITTGLTANTSASVIDNPYSFLVEYAGGGNIPTQTAGAPFNIEIIAQNASSATLTSFNATDSLYPSIPGGTISPTTTSSFVNGVLSSQSVTLSQAATNQTITASHGTTGTSNTFNVVTGTFAKLQILLPGETAAPGTTTGKTGSPTAITSGTALTATVNAVDANWNVISTATDSIKITSSDAFATLPANARLVSGTKTFSVTLFTAPSQFVVATDVTNSGITDDTSAIIVVNPATIITTSTGGNWNVGSTWVGGIVPVPTDNAIIASGATATVTANATVNSVTYNNTGTGTGTITVNNGVTLTVTTTITAQNGTTINTAAAMAGAGTITCASVTLGGIIPTAGGLTSSLTSTISNLSISGNLNLLGYDNGSGAQDKPTFALQSGTTMVGGSVSTSEGGTPGGSGGIVTFIMATGAQTGILNLAGSTPFSLANSYAITLNGAASTVIYSGTAQTVLPTAYYNLTLSGSGNKSMGAGISVGEVLSITGSGAVQANISNGLDINVVDRLWLGGVAQAIGTWGSTTSPATHQNNTYFTATTGYLTIASPGAPSSFSGVTASQTICFGTPSITLSGTVNGPGSLYPVMGETISVIINGNSQNTTITDGTGDFSINYSSSSIPASGSSYTITYLYPGNDTLNPSVNTSTTLLVNAIPSAPTATDADYCGSSTLTASNYTGTLLWNTSATTSSISVTAGTYSVAQTVSGCTSPAGTVTASPLTVPSTPVVTDVDNCASSTLSTTATGSLSWSTGSTASSITVTIAGTYSVTQTAGNGCTSATGTGSASPMAIPSAPTVTDVDNCGNSTLSTTATGLLSWNTGATTSSIMVTASGTYSVTQTISGCTSPIGYASASPISIPLAPSVSDADCAEVLLLLQAITQEHYRGARGEGTSSIAVSTAGSYSVTQTVNGCTSAQNSGTATPLTLPSPSFTAQPGASTCTFANVTYTTLSLQSNYIWTIPGTLNTDYSITSGSAGTGSNTVTLQWLTTGSKTVTINYTSSNGCTATSPTSSTATSANNCFFDYTIKFFVQGYYHSGGTMSPLLNLLGISASATAVDTATIELRTAASPATVAYSYTGILQSNGNLVCTFPGDASGNSYYIVVKHRNSLTTWSTDSISMVPSGTYDFTGGLGQAYGNNLVSLENGIYGIYSGDINQDGNINGSDKTSLQGALPSFIVGGYNVNDVTGDGFVDEDDFRVLQNNTSLNISLRHP